VIAAFIALVVAACAEPAASVPSVAPDATPAIVPASPVEGVVVRVETSGLNDFRGFQLRLDSGEIVVFTLGRLENAAEFPPNHLPEHLAASDRLRIWFVPEGDALVVYRMEHGEGVDPPG